MVKQNRSVAHAVHAACNVTQVNPFVQPDSRFFDTSKFGEYAHLLPASMTDDDLYKFTMAAAVLALYPNTNVCYRFTDRSGKGRWTAEALKLLKKCIKLMSKLALTPWERQQCEKRFPWINRMFWDWLAAYRYDGCEVKVWLNKRNDLEIEIRGLWCRTILWEVKLLAVVANVFFTEIDTNWTEEGQIEKMERKALNLANEQVSWADMGTRRRRHLEAQERVVVIGKKYKNFTGTSNVYLALKHDVKALGTMAHEWIMAHSALFSLLHANKFALEAWNYVYKGNLGTALPDTFGTEAFLKDFQGQLARLFDSARQDSGEPIAWFEMMIAHYISLSINWRSKMYGFTDGNTDQTAISINKYVKGKGGDCWFGIGTYFSNDYGPESPACNIVIKLTAVEVDGRWIPVVKLSDTPSKATGDDDAVRNALWTHHGTPLDDASHKQRKVHGHEPVPIRIKPVSRPRLKKAA